MKQPDFESAFLALDPPPIRYSAREGATWFHDLLYLGSLVRDARIVSLHWAGKRGALRMKLVREHWPPGQRSPSKVPSELTISPVTSIALEGTVEPGIFDGEPIIRFGPVLDTICALPNFRWNRRGPAIALLSWGNSRRLLLNCGDADFPTVRLVDEAPGKKVSDGKRPG